MPVHDPCIAPIVPSPKLMVYGPDPGKNPAARRLTSSGAWPDVGEALRAGGVEQPAKLQPTLTPAIMLAPGAVELLL